MFISLLTIIQLPIIGINPNLDALPPHGGAEEGEFMMSTVHVHGSGALVAARLEATARSLMARLLGWFERVGRARAVNAIRRLETTRVVEAGQLRRYAQQWAQQDPRMTADLMAAADRHEQGY